MRRSVGSRGAATSRAALDARVGGSFIQSAIRLPSTAPSALASSATHATTAISASGRDLDRFGAGDEGGSSDCGGPNDGAGAVAVGGPNGEPEPGDDQGDGPGDDEDDDGDEGRVDG